MRSWSSRSARWVRWRGRVGVATVAYGALASAPLPRAADGRLVLAVDVTCWLRPEAHTSPERILCHTYGRGKDQHIGVPGWPYSFVVALESGRSSWTAPLDAVRLAPGADLAAVTATQLREVLGRLVDGGHWEGEGEVDDHGDVLVALTGVTPDMLVHADPRTPSNRPFLSISTRLPSASTASFAVFHARPSPSATRPRSGTGPPALPAPTAGPPRQLRPRLGHPAGVLAPHMSAAGAPVTADVTTKVMGRQPSGSCASRRVTVSRGDPSQPHRRHLRSGSTTQQASTARSGSSHCPVTSRPSVSSRANVVRSGRL